MTIDPHFHLLQEDFFPPEIWKMLSEQMTGHVTGDRSHHVGLCADPESIGASETSAERFLAEMVPKFWDPEAERLLAKMEECDIEQTVLLADDFGVHYGGLPSPLQDQNKAIADLAARHPDKLIPFCSVDPRRPDTIQILRTCIEEWGMKGVGELHPDTGWAPSGRESYRMLSRIEDWGVPILVHTGLFFPPMHSRHTQPMELDDVCSDFPNLTVIAGHSGRTLWWREVAHLAAVHPNLYAELAGFQTVALKKPAKFREILREFIDICGPHKILWASDDPVYNETGLKTKDYLDTMRGLPDDDSDGLSFTTAEIDAILGENSKRILGS